MAINFPDSPSTGDTIAVNGSTWLWNGSTWIDAFESQASLNINSLLDVNLTSSTTGEVVQYNGTEWVNADIIAQIVDSAPGALNTLNELAAALGDDENFASTVTTSLSGKAPTVHSHAISDVTSLQAGLDSKAESAHDHVISEVTSLQSSLDAKQAIVSGVSDTEIGYLDGVTSAIQGQVDGKADSAHVHIVSEVTSLQASLDSRKLETTYSIAADTTLVAGGRYIVDTGAARTLTLPAGPAVGDELSVIDSTNQAETYNITINNGGSLINGASDTLVVDVNGAIATLVYTGSTLGWRI